MKRGDLIKCKMVMVHWSDPQDDNLILIYNMTKRTSEYLSLNPKRSNEWVFGVHAWLDVETLRNANGGMSVDILDQWEEVVND